MTAMVLYMIGGYKKNPAFSHVCYIANVLSQMLPDFNYEAIAFEFDEWKVNRL